jgi:hypothetical protein
MIRQGTHGGGAFCPSNLVLAGIGGFGFALQLFEHQFQLLDLQGKLLGRLAEGQPPQLRKLEAKRLDQRIAGRGTVSNFVREAI